MDATVAGPPAGETLTGLSERYSKLLRLRELKAQIRQLRPELERLECELFGLCSLGGPASCHMHTRSKEASVMLMRLIGVLAAASLAACATCRDHPVACGIGAALVAGSIAASLDHGSSSSSGMQRTIGTPACAQNPASCH